MRKTMLALAVIPVSLGSVLAVPGQAHAQPTSCVRFVDDQGNGQAFSLAPGAKVYSGEGLVQVKTDKAWRFCFPFADGHGLLRLKYDQSYCVSGYHHGAHLYKCASSSANQQFKQRKHRSPFYFRLLNRNGVMAAVGDGAGYADVVEQISGGTTQWVTA